ncbi:phosphoribosyltransferase [Nitratiruptor tergarcus]|uniref:Xanthine phosphoribosyltransferase n=1 Tax=Nitratiruptor tergarcus DSM 16512 TaxID=1069081 RepID=A0A1W1WTE1_9BACT|nr:phosphoribosyltransferase family protein [Nitratiruptor tergarcus]SMC09320.1 xanthine phosphoribosyltransferase [Nitratiruptor tergarcus DSM 16512]
MRYYSYEEFIRDLKTLTKKIDFKFDAIVAISRGGLTIAHFLGEYYNIRSVYAISAIGYEDQKKLPCVTIGNIPDLSCHERILIVDEIVDSGETLERVIAQVKEKFPHLICKSAVLFYKSSAKFQPDFFVQYADEWIDFFWTRDLHDTYDR